MFAIATTLLVLDLAVPESEFHHLWHGIGHQWPGYLGYATSFLTIGGIWLGHTESSDVCGMPTAL